MIEVLSVHFHTPITIDNNHVTEQQKKYPIVAVAKKYIGKVGKVSNFGAVGDGSDKSKVGKVSNFGTADDGRRQE